MGWFWDAKSSNGSNSSDSDAYSKLDPSLRDFLEKQSLATSASDRPNTQSSPQPPPTEDKPYRAQLGLNVPGVNQENQNATPRTDTPEVPPESLFQDGRYAHLWKGYRPQSQIEAESRSDQDRLTAVYETLAERKAAIGRAALENCIEEQMAEKLCYSQGSVKQRLTMCRTESRAFNRCYSMQSRFLKALGYLSAQHTSLEAEEKIQMHADKLYHEMLDREAAMDQAKELGVDKPVFNPLITSDTTTAALGEDSVWARARRKAEASGKALTLLDFPVDKQKEIKERIKELSESEREVELQLIAGENRALQEYADALDREMEVERRNRQEREARGRATVGDTIKSMWGFGER